jgi:hypothetical protein
MARALVLVAATVKQTRASHEALPEMVDMPLGNLPDLALNGMFVRLPLPELYKTFPGPHTMH